MMKVSLVVDTVKNTVKVHRHNCSDITAAMDSGEAEFASQGDVLDRFDRVQVTFLKCLKDRLPVSSSPKEADTDYVEPQPEVTPEVEPAPVTPAVTPEPQPAEAPLAETTERAIESMEAGTVVTSANQHLYKTRDIKIEAVKARTATLTADVYGKLMWMSDRTVVFKVDGAPKSRSAKNVRVTLV